MYSIGFHFGLTLDPCWRTSCFEIRPSFSYHSALDLKCRGRPEAPPFRDSCTPLGALCNLPVPPPGSKMDLKKIQGDLARTLVKPSGPQGGPGPQRWPRWWTGSRNYIVRLPFWVPVPTVKTVLPCTQEHDFRVLGHCHFTHFSSICSDMTQELVLSTLRALGDSKDSPKGPVQYGRINEVRRLSFIYIYIYSIYV